MSILNFACMTLPRLCMKGGGGGGAGEQSWPAYMEDFHKELLLDGLNPPDGIKDMEDGVEPSICAAIYEAWDHSPYEGEGPYDPTHEINRIYFQFDKYANLIREFNANTQYEACLAEAKAQVDKLISVEASDQMVANYERNQSKVLSKAVSRFKAGMADVGAVNGSAFVIGLALLNSEHMQNVSQFNEQMQFQTYRDRLGMYQQAVQDLSRFIALKLDGMKSRVMLGIDVNKISALAKREYVDQDLDLKAKDAVWNMEILQHGANILAGISGATGNTPGGMMGGQSKTQTGLAVASGAMTGAATGAGIGAALMYAGAINAWNPGGWIAMGAGAIVGGTAGYAASQG